jgi:flagellar basal-body rod protein FlgB
MLGSIFDTTAFRAARQGLTGLSQRQQAIASNIANIDTPGYQRREVSFEDTLRQEVAATGAGGGLTRTDPRHFGGGGTASELASGSRSRDVVASRNDANTVDVDEEMMLMVDTQLRYQALSQSIGTRINTLRSVIRGG